MPARSAIRDVARNLTRVPPDQRKELPTISGPALGGSQTISTQDFRGKVVVINVWGSWCPPCRKEAPDLQAASVETKDIAQFVGITSKDYDPAPAEAFVRSFKITYPSIYDPSGKVLLAFAGELPPSAIPSTHDHRPAGPAGRPGAERGLQDHARGHDQRRRGRSVDDSSRPRPVGPRPRSAARWSWRCRSRCSLGWCAFFSPCVVPLLPGYLSYATGLGAAEVVEGSPRDAAGCSPAPRSSCSGSRRCSSSTGVVAGSAGRLLAGISRA